MSTPNPPRENLVRAVKTCSVDGCNRAFLAKGMCSYHYQLHKRQTAPTCTIDVCDRPQKASGLCAGHYSRKRRGGDLTSAVRRGRFYGQGRYGKDGYILVWVGKDDPAANAEGYILEHRLVMSRLLGRKLHPWENVHHKNGIRDDNRAENLELWVKPQPAGARLDDLIAFIVDNYPEAVDAHRSRRAQLRLIVNREAV